jgi:iron complex transport system substrate-binding protein
VPSRKQSNKEQTGRIVSFLPSSTEILYEIGAGDQITGVTHECKYPGDAKNKPRVINSSFDASNLTSREIDDKIGGLMRVAGDIYLIDDQKLKEAKPDLIIAQGVCEVCAPFAKEIDRANSILGYKPDVLVLDPHNLDDILISIMDIAERVGRVNEGRKLVVALQNRIDNVRMIVEEKKRILRHPNSSNRFVKVKKDNTKRKVVCIEWIDPFFIAGHWIPQMVDIAGGFNGLGTTGQPSRRVSIGEIIEFDPDKIILMPCGFDLERTLKEAKVLKNNNKWNLLQAVRRNEVYAANANEYFSKPGPRTIAGLEILAKIIDPGAFRNIESPSNSFVKVIDK